MARKPLPCERKRRFCEKRSAQMKARWQDPEFRARMSAARGHDIEPKPPKKRPSRMDEAEFRAYNRYMKSISVQRRAAGMKTPPRTRGLSAGSALYGPYKGKVSPDTHFRIYSEVPLWLIEKLDNAAYHTNEPKYAIVRRALEKELQRMEIANDGPYPKPYGDQGLRRGYE